MSLGRSKLHAIRHDEVNKILELTDSFNLHRECIFIPLATEKGGSVPLEHDERLRIVCSSTAPFEEWLTELRKQLERIDLSKLPVR